MDLRRCGSSSGVEDADEFCAKDKVACARVTAANSKILAILTEHPFRNNYVKPSKHQVLSIGCAAMWRLYRGISLAKHADIGKSSSAANRMDWYPAMSETKSWSTQEDAARRQMVHLFPWMIPFKLHRNRLLSPTPKLGGTQ
jgi:hypothetical protein